MKFTWVDPLKYKGLRLSCGGPEPLPVHIYLHVHRCPPSVLVFYFSSEN